MGTQDSKSRLLRHAGFATSQMQPGEVRVGHLFATYRWKRPVKCLAQRHNKQACRLVLHTILCLC